MFLAILRRFALVGLLVFSFYVGLSRFATLITFWNPQLVQKNEVVVWENRLGRVKQELPADVTHVGYLSEWDFPENQLPSGLERDGYITEWDLPAQYRDVGSLNEFRLTKYTLAPIIVERGSDFPWIIGNFSSNKPFKPWLQEILGKYEIKEIGGGIYLIRRVGQ